METLYAFGLLVGLMKAHAEPPKVAPVVEQRQLAQQQVAQHSAPTEKLQQHGAKKGEWLLSY